MPIPKPKKDQKKDEFISSCMSILNEEYPDNKQRAAVCFSQWKKYRNDSEDNINKKVDREFTINLDSKSTMRTDSTTGFLHCEGRLTRTGVLIYRDENGNISRREYRSPEEVFKQDSLDTLKLKPITNFHPDEKIVNLDNVKIEQIGYAGENIIPESNKFVKGNLVLTDKDIINSVLNKKKMNIDTQISCGYICDLIPQEGYTEDGEFYDYIQKNIEYNHVALCGNNGRAGKEVRILDHNMIKKNKENKMGDKLIQFELKKVNTDSFNMDSISLNINEDNVSVMNNIKDKFNEAVDVIINQESEIKKIKNDSDGLQAKYDQLKNDHDKLKEDNSKILNIDSEEFNKLFNDKKRIIDVATKLGVDVENKTVTQIKLDCIKHTSKDFNSENKSQSYIDARFDVVCENVDEHIKNDSKNSLSEFVKNAQNRNDGEKKESPRDLFIKMDIEKNRK